MLLIHIACRCVPFYNLPVYIELCVYQEGSENHRSLCTEFIPEVLKIDSGSLWTKSILVLFNIKEVQLARFMDK